MARLNGPMAGFIVHAANWATATQVAYASTDSCGDFHLTALVVRRHANVKLDHAACYSFYTLRRTARRELFRKTDQVAGKGDNTVMDFNAHSRCIDRGSHFSSCATFIFNCMPLFTEVLLNPVCFTCHRRGQAACLA